MDRYAVIMFDGGWVGCLQGGYMSQLTAVEFAGGCSTPLVHLFSVILEFLEIKC